MDENNLGLAERHNTAYLCSLVSTHGYNVRRNSKGIRVQLMATWERSELEILYPEGSVSVQEDENVRLMTTDEWSAWIDQQVGTEKMED